MMDLDKMLIFAIPILFVVGVSTVVWASGWKLATVPEILLIAPISRNAPAPITVKTKTKSDAYWNIREHRKAHAQFGPHGLLKRRVRTERIKKYNLIHT